MTPPPPHDDYDDDSEPRAHDDEEAGVEALTWQLLLLVNPGDEEAAQQQFHAWEDALATQGIEPDGAEAFARLRQVIDWRAGFDLAADDTGGLVECLEELAARFGVSIDWGSDEPGEAEFLDEVDAPTLLGRAHASLREHGYSLWAWHWHGEVREDRYAGAITLRREDEALEIVAAALGLALRPGSGF